MVAGVTTRESVEEADLLPAVIDEMQKQSGPMPALLEKEAGNSEMLQRKVVDLDVQQEGTDQGDADELARSLSTEDAAAKEDHQAYDEINDMNANIDSSEITVALKPSVETDHLDGNAGAAGCEGLQPEEGRERVDTEDIADFVSAAPASTVVMGPLADVGAAGRVADQRGTTPEDDGAAAQQWRLRGKPQQSAASTATPYPTFACKHFGESFPHRLRWAHAVNSRHRLLGVLGTGAHFFEADVSSGPLVSNPPLETKTESGQRSANGRAVRRRMRLEEAACRDTLRTANGESIIMAHYPTQLQSDLSLEDFITMVLNHNQRAASRPTRGPVEVEARHNMKLKRERAASGGGQEAATPTAATGQVQEAPEQAAEKLLPNRAEPGLQPGRGVPIGPSRQPQQDAESGDEAVAFVKELNSELDHAHATSSAFTSCVGSRRDVHGVKKLTPKGVKLDFKKLETVEPAIEFLRSIDAVNRLGGHLWLNADVFQGPGGWLTPFDAQAFVKLCAEGLPEAVISLSWGSSVLSTTRLYTNEMVQCMIELCMNPIVPRPLSPAPSRSQEEAVKVKDGSGSAFIGQVSGPPPAGGSLASRHGSTAPLAKEDADRSQAEAEEENGDVMLVPAAAVCRHITFAVAAEYALKSKTSLHRLLQTVPGSSLTVFSGVGSLGITPAYVQDLISAYGKSQLFLDLKLSKAWRTCSQGQCAVM